MILRVKRFKQQPGECAVAASAAITNFYDKTTTYRSLRKIADPDGTGMYSPQIGLLLNKIGFTKITIVSSDVNQLDFAWRDLTKEQLIDVLKKSVKKNKDKDYKEVNQLYMDFLLASPDNNVIIDHAFGRHVRTAIDNGKPVLASFNWNMFFKWTKWNDSGKEDPVLGDTEEHEVVVCGYDEKGVNIVDSHHEMYKGKLKKFKNGRYKMPWETLMTVMGYGDLIIPEGFSEPEEE